MIKRLVILLCITGLITSCSNVSPGGYYWGNYSYTYHQLIKEPTSENRAKHQATLQDIIAESEKLNLRVPPGIHAELGNLLELDDQTESAIAQFSEEVRLYPESEVFIGRLLSRTSTGDKE